MVGSGSNFEVQSYQWTKGKRIFKVKSISEIAETSSPKEGKHLFNINDLVCVGRSMFAVKITFEKVFNIWSTGPNPTSWHPQKAVSM